jgi:hypothetical protein
VDPAGDPVGTQWVAFCAMRPTNVALMKLTRRAEAAVNEQMLVDTFVDVGPLFTLLSSGDHQIVYGRRGTGKTHALSYLRARADGNGDVAALIDLRTIGSTGGLYSDSKVPLTERGTRLLADVLGQLHETLVDYALERAEAEDMTAALSLLDRLADAITQVEVVGEHVAEAVEGYEANVRDGGRVSAGISGSGPQLSAAAEASSSATDRSQITMRASGVAQHRVHFGDVSQVLRRLVEALGVGRVWVLLDEWAAVPLELQPLLADLHRRAVFPVRGMVVKIAAIEQRSQFELPTQDGADYIGIEVGADAAADLDLDDYMVFGNDPDAAKNFFRELLYRHVRAQMLEDGQTPPANAGEFQRVAFTQRNVFDEFVRAAEGVPRDAINIVRSAAQRAGQDPIAVEHIRTAARRWFLTDKEKAVSANPNAARLLHWVIDTVIGERRARAFLLHQNERQNPLIIDLYDARVLHVIKRSVSSRDHPGERYDVYALDFGCYVELITTTRAPQGLYEAGAEDVSGWVEVPSDDYRSIRRAILDLDEFAKAAAG